MHLVPFIFKAMIFFHRSYKLLVLDSIQNKHFEFFFWFKSILKIIKRVFQKFLNEYFKNIFGLIAFLCYSLFVFTMGQTEIKYSLKIKCFTNCFFKTFRRAGIFRTKKYPRRPARVKFYQICLKDFLR